MTTFRRGKDRKPNFYINMMLVDYYVSPDLNYRWNFGSILGAVLGLQIGTGLLLAIAYTADIGLAFQSTDQIMTNLHNGWLMRSLHANGASFFFIAMYAHILRGLYYGSYTRPRHGAWYYGVAILFLSMGVAFLGYSLPWGQMSYWAVTVITNMITVIPVVGEYLLQLVWGGESICNSTLKRFFVLHFLLPFAISLLSVLHLLSLHVSGSTSPSCTSEIRMRIPFHPYFTTKDSLGFIVLIGLLSVFAILYPDYFGHPDNYIPANAFVTPAHIVPEWYFLPYYAILRCCSNKTQGVIALILSVGFLFLMPVMTARNAALPSNSVIYRLSIAVFTFNFIYLGYLGMCPVEDNYIYEAYLAMLIHFSLVPSLVLQQLCSSR